MLPLLLAVSANSPFLDGLDTGLHSARTQTFTKSFPRCGIPDAYGSWAAYRDYLDLLVRTNSIVEYTQVWWSVRPHFSFGTVEVRICDAQSTAAGVRGACRRSSSPASLQAARDEDEGVPFATRRAAADRGEPLARDPLRPRRADDRPRRAATEYPAAAIAERLLAWTAPVRAEPGSTPRFPDAQRRPAPAAR